MPFEWIRIIWLLKSNVSGATCLRMKKIKTIVSKLNQIIIIFSPFVGKC